MNKFFKRILPATILATCCTVSVFSMTACNEGKDYSEDIAKLQQQIEDLQTENNTLKDKVNNLTPGGVDYTEEIEALQQQIETLKAKNESNLFLMLFISYTSFVDSYIIHIRSLI